MSTCMDCGATTDAAAPTGWSHDYNGDVRCPTCTTAATFRYDECLCGHDRWQHIERSGCLVTESIRRSDGDEANGADCACRAFADA